MCAASLGMALVVSSVGCASRLRRDFLGRGGATVTAVESTPGDAASPSSAPGSGAVGVHAGDTLEIAWTITQPRAERLRYAIACGGNHLDPIEVGETFEQYQARRVAELRAERDRQRAVVSSVASAFVPNVAAQGTVQTANGQGTVTAGVDREAVGDAVAANVVSDEIVLPPGDVGAGALTGVETITALADGPCEMTVFTDTAGVVGVYSVTRVVDVAAEKRARDEAQRAAAIEARGQLTASLYAAGAQDRVEVVATAPAVPAVDAQVDAQVDVQVDTRLDTRLDASMDIRGQYVWYLVGQCHADPHKREKDRERQRVLEAQRYQLSLDLRARLYAQLVVWGADPEHRTKLRLAAEDRARAAQAAEDALLAVEGEARATRTAMVDFLVLLGARMRPPMPAPVVEDGGAPPFSGAVWVAGQWLWIGADWQWQPGGWGDGTSFSGDVHVDNAGWTTRDHRPASLPTPTSVDVTPTDTWTTRDHRPEGNAGGVIVRDHRPEPRPARESRDVVVRDHRDDAKDKKDKHDDKDDKKDDKVIVRDHRR
jgi:hypothetical protein